MLLSYTRRGSWKEWEGQEEGWLEGWKAGRKAGRLRRGTVTKLPDVLKLGGPMPLLLDLFKLFKCPGV